MLRGQGLQHFLVPLAAADFLPAPAVKSGFVAVYCGHVPLLPCGLTRVFLVVPAAGEWPDGPRRRAVP